jgi:hypothetical protein
MANYGQKCKGPSKASVLLSVSRTYVIPTRYRRYTDVDFQRLLGIGRGPPQQFVQLPPNPTMRDEMSARVDIKGNLMTVIAVIPRGALEF